MSKRKKNLGKLGEQLAKKLLQNKGYKFIIENFHCRFGEIDLIFQDKETLVFVEVKTRWSNKFGIPEEAITPRKIKSIVKTGEYFKTLHSQLSKSLRIDAVAIELTPDNFKLKSVRHIKSITS